MKLRNTILGLTLMLGMGACHEKFDNMNVDPTQNTNMDAAMKFTSVLNRGTNASWGDFQMMQEFYVNLYAQYFACTKASFSTGRYTMNDPWIENEWSTYYAKSIILLNEIIADGDELSNNSIQMSRIVKVFIYHRMTDMWGNIPYSEGAIPEDQEGAVGFPKYDKQKDIYKDMLSELDDAINKLDSKEDPISGFGTQDVIYKADANHWKKFAASLMLRLATRVNKVDPELAKEYGQIALTHGVFTSNLDNAILPRDVANRDAANALQEVSFWDEYRMSKTMELYMNGEKLGAIDPRLEMYWAPTGHRKNPNDLSDPVNFAGMPNGTSASNVGNFLTTASSIGPIGAHYTYDGENEKYNPDNSGRTLNHFLFTYSEVCFLKAEAALHGWMGAGSAEDNYKAGIEASMSQWSTNNPSYTGKVPNSNEISNYVNSVSKGGIDLEKIITQKWIALFPDGFESWAEFRRTGYPQMMSVEAPDASAGLGGGFIQRLPYPQIEADMNPNEDNSKINLAEKMWWAK